MKRRPEHIKRKNLSSNEKGRQTSCIGLAVLLILVFPACTEVYTPELESGQNILYIEGGISDAPGPHSIKLRYTAGYNDRADFKPVSGASLILREEGTDRLAFTEEEAGIYVTDSLFQAVPGLSYKIIIETADGYVYESASQKMPVNNLPVDSVYGYRERRKIKYYNVYGELILLDQDVNQVYADIASATENTWYRFDCQLVLEHASAIVANAESVEPDVIDLYLWDSFFPDDLTVIEVNAGRDRLRKFPLTHALEDNESYSQLKYKYFPAITHAYDLRIRNIVQVETETDSGFVLVDSIIYGIPVEMHESDYYYGWIMKINQYSITQEAYTFWSDVKKLEETEGEIFDPITTQLRGNMVCVTDADRPVLGLFEVSSLRVTTAFVNYLSEFGFYPGKQIDILPDFPDNGWKDTVPPDFWVDKVFTYGKATDLIHTPEE